jgi:hypothetical protein
MSNGVVRAAGHHQVRRRDTVKRGHGRRAGGGLRLGIAVEAGGEVAGDERREGFSLASSLIASAAERASALAAMSIGGRARISGGLGA